MVTKTTEEAMELLEQYRAELLESARIIAAELIAVDGTTNTKRVREVMGARGLINPKVPDHWLGAVFNKKRFRWTGDWTDGFEGVKAHSARPVKVWTAL